MSSISAENSLIGKYNKLAKLLYPHIPFTYYWYLSRIVGREGESLIDFGCGWGDPVEVLQKIKRRTATGVDVFEKYLKVAKRKKIYDRLVKSEVTKFKEKDKYDFVFCFHVLEHLPKNKGLGTIKYFESIAKKKVVIALPVGQLAQDEYDGNSYQKHLSEWEPDEFRSLGYTVHGFSPKFLYGQKDVIKDYKIFGFLLFLLSYLLGIFYINRPEKCVYMLAYKNI